jgi:hypothetical protein
LLFITTFLPPKNLARSCGVVVPPRLAFHAHYACW